MNDGRGKIYSVKKFSEKSGIDKQRLYYYIKTKKFKHFKIDRSILFYEQDFIDFLEKHLITPDQPKELIVDDEIALK